VKLNGFQKGSSQLSKSIRTDLKPPCENFDMCFAEFSFAAEDGSAEGAVVGRDRSRSWNGPWPNFRIVHHNDAVAVGQAIEIPFEKYKVGITKK
jgi:hypothetical protein